MFKFCGLFRLRAVVFYLLGAVIIGNSQAWSQTIKFTDVTVKMGVRGNLAKTKTGEMAPAYAHGVIMADINNDELPDIYISNAMRYADKLPEVLYVSSPTGYVESDGARRCSDSFGWTGSHGIVFFDYDNDGDYDIYNATTDDRNRLYANDGNGYFTHMSDAAGLPLIREVYEPFDGAPYGYGTRGVVAFDANNDGYLDLLGVNWGPAETRYDESTNIVIPEQPNEFNLNNGNGTFTSVDNALTLPKNTWYMGTQGVLAGDVDMDGDVDVFIIHRNYTAYTPTGELIRGFNSDYEVDNQLLINDGLGNFTDETKIRNLDNPFNDANGATFADYDNDGDLDIFIPPTNKSGTGLLTVYRNDGRGYFNEVTKTINIPQWGFTTYLFDVDNDGDLDILAPKTREYSRLYLNNGTGTFTEKPNAGVELYNYDSRGGAVGDIDGDGDLDIYISDANKDLKVDLGSRMFRNDLVSANRWIRITGRGPKGDMGGFGTKVWVYDRGFVGQANHLVGYHEIMNAYGYLSQDDPVQHFGLGARDSVDVKVQMLDKTTLTMLSAPAKTRLFFSKPNLVTQISGDNQSADINKELAQPLKVEVRDSFGNLVYGAKVVFASDDPTAQFLPSATVYTKKDGTAKVRYKLGGKLAQKITASCEEAPANSASFTVTGTSTLTAQLTMLSGDQQSGYTNQLLPQPLKVKVTNLSGAPQQGKMVDFHIVTGAATLEPSSSVMTDASGVAAVNLRLGATAGSVTVYAEADQVLNSPIVFTAQAQTANITVVQVSGDQQTGTVGARLAQETVVRSEFITGGAAPNASVTFSVVSGGGSIDGSTSKTVTSDAQGVAKVFWTLGTVTGVQAMYASCGNGTVAFSATAQADKPNQMAAVSGSGQTVTPGAAFPTPFAVVVKDRYNNPVTGAAVLFQVTNGNGAIEGVKQQTVITAADGVASVRWTADPYLGAPNTMQASASSDGAAVLNSPIQWSFPATDVSSTFSTVTATSPILADGVERSEVVITLRNSSNQLLGAGYSVELSATGTDNQITYANQKTDANSVARGYLASATPEQKTVSAKVLGLNLTLSAQPIVEFQPANQTPDKMLLISGNAQVGTVGKPLGEPFVIKVLDIAGRPMRNFDVQFVVITGEGTFDGSSTRLVKTGSDGLATALLTLGRTAGNRTFVQVRAERVSNSPLTLYADSRAAEARQLLIVSGNNQNGSPNTVLPQQLVVRVTDLYDNPIGGISVQYKVNTGDCFVDGLSQRTIITDIAGLAKTTVRLGTSMGQSIIEAKTDFSSVTFIVTTSDNRAVPDLQRSTVTCTSPVPADGISRSEVVVTLLDRNGSAVAGHGVRVSAVGDAVQVAQTDSLSDPLGKVKAYVTSAVAGAKIILVYLRPENTVLEQRGIVEFREGKPQIALLSGDIQTGTVGKPCPQPLRVRVTSESYALAGQVVSFSTVSGGGHFNGQTTTTATTNAEGVAEASYFLGPVAGENKVQASLPSQSGQTVQFTLKGKADAASQLTKEGGDNQTAGLKAQLPQRLFVIARDLYNNPAPLTSVTFEAIDGGKVVTPQPVLTDSLGRAQADVALAEREGPYTFKAMLTNGTMVLFTATAQNNNHAPVVISYEPAAGEVPFHYSDRLTFEIVQVFDVDHDVIQYEWYLNNRLVGNQSKLALLMSSSFPILNTLRCSVSDGLAGEDINWTLKLKSSVELTGLTVEMVKGRGVQVIWKTRSESDNPHFNIYRSQREDGAYERINRDLIAGTSRTGDYAFDDVESLSPGKYYYKLESVGTAGLSSWFGPVNVTIQTPESLVLHQNYPNPFNPSTSIAFELPKTAQVRLAVFNNSGQEIRQLLNEEMQAGMRTVVWDAKNEQGLTAPSGLYFIILTCDGQSQTRKLTLLK